MSGSLAGEMRLAARRLLAGLDEERRGLAARAFDDSTARRWVEYRPRPRPGACVADMSVAGRKAAHRLLATGLSEHAHAQAMVIVALEEMLDRRESWRRGRHSGDYWVAVFGNPDGDEPWGWRFEGHHLSVTMTLVGDEVSAAPVFLGANPARVGYAGHTVSRPLAPEEDLARALLDALGPAGRARAVVAEDPPPDIRSGPRPDFAGIEPAGIAGSALGPSAQTLLAQLTALYLDRLPPELAAREQSRLAAGSVHFAWEGPLTPGAPHYYRVQADNLLIEYDNTSDDGNHAHTVLRRPRGDSGADLLAAHYASEHPSAGG